MSYRLTSPTGSTGNSLTTQAGSNKIKAKGKTDIRVESDAGGKIYPALWSYSYELVPNRGSYREPRLLLGNCY